MPHSAVMLRSVLRQTPGLEVHVHYLHGPGFRPRAASRLARMVDRLGASITFVEVVDEHCRGLPTEGFTGKATWYKVLLPELLPQVDRILHLDCDTVALDSLTPLWSTDLDGNHVAAVTNVLPQWYADRVSALGLDGPDAYFNAGVLLLDLDSMRREGCSRAMIEYGVEHAPDLVLRDQDVLNAVLADRRAPLHPRWNCMNAILSFPEARERFGAGLVEEARRQPAIRHFEGPGENKPWHLLCRWPGREAYRAHRRRTPWPLWTPAGLTPANVARRVKRRVSA